MSRIVNGDWEELPLTDEETFSKSCDMLGANPPSVERCGRPASVKHIRDGEIHYWCARCRRKYWPTDSEKEEDARTAKRDQRIADIIYKFVLTPIGWMFGLVLTGACIYGVVAFIHWCWNHS